MAKSLNYSDVSDGSKKSKKKKELTLNIQRNGIMDTLLKHLIFGCFFIKSIR